MLIFRTTTSFFKLMEIISIILVSSDPSVSWIERCIIFILFISGSRIYSENFFHVLGLTIYFLWLGVRFIVISSHYFRYECLFGVLTFLFSFLRIEEDFKFDHLFENETLERSSLYMCYIPTI